jgi:hypothetical protein
MPKISIITKDFLYNQYISLNKTAQQIANETQLSYSYIQSKIKSFGIKRKRQYIDLTGQTYNKLRVLRFSHIKNDNVFWECQCFCGKIKIMRAACIRHKKGTCGNCGTYKEISGRAFHRIKNNARQRNIVFEIDIKSIWDLFIKQDRRCAISGVELCFNKDVKLNTASLDRINSSIGYIINNVQWVHKDVNQIKMDFSEAELFKWIKTIYENKKLNIISSN